MTPNQSRGSDALVEELNLMCQDIASELRKIREEGNILSNDKNFDKIITLIEKASKIKTLTTAEKKTDDKVVEMPVITNPEKKPKNIQDFAMNGKTA